MNSISLDTCEQIRVNGKKCSYGFFYPVGGMNADRFCFINLEDFEKGEDTVLFNKPYKYVTKGLSFKK